MARLCLNYLAFYNNENSPNKIFFCQSIAQILPNTKWPLKTAKKFSNFALLPDRCINVVGVAVVVVVDVVVMVIGGRRRHRERVVERRERLRLREEQMWRESQILAESDLLTRRCVAFEILKPSSSSSSSSVLSNFASAIDAVDQR